MRSIRVGLYDERAQQTDADLMLVNHLIARLDDAREPAFKRLRGA